MRRVSVLVPVLVLLAPVLVLVRVPQSQAAPAAAAAGLAHYEFLPAQVFGQVAIGMPDERTIKIQHLDPVTGQWDAPTTLVHTRGRVTCGAIDGRASSGGVALIAECDTPYYEDQAPAHSIALVSRDGRSWNRTRLPGEAYHAPAVSPSGTYAAWLAGGTGDYVEWSASTGFAKPAETTYGYDSGGETPVVDDTGTVTVIGPETTGPRDSGSCVIGIHTRDLNGVRTHTQVTHSDPGCTEGVFDNIDALTVLGGGSERATQFTLARASVGAPWAVTKVAPVEAPGLVHYGYSRKRITTYFLYSSAPSTPIVAIGSPDRHRVMVQRFDDATHSWGPETQVHSSARRCQDAYLDLPTTPAYVADLRCGRSHVVLVSPDATTWTVRSVGRRPWTVWDLGVALPGPTGTTVVQGADVREFPVTTDGPCDVVHAGRPGELVRLHGGAHGWPAKVQVSTGGAFHTVSRSRRLPEPCRRVTVFADRLLLEGRHHAREGQLVLSGDTWKLRYLKAVDIEPR